MNAESTLTGGSGPAPGAGAYADIPAGRRLIWLLRCELWENRSIYLAPCAIAAILLAGHLLATIGRAMATPDLAERQALLEQTSYFSLAVLMGVMFLVSVLYCLDALHGERRDRSILFWKSLPVSDEMTVLSKALIPIVVIPLVTFAVSLAVQFLMLVMNSLALQASGLETAPLWDKASLFQNSVAVLYHLVAIHGLWYAPIYGWLLLASAWAQRAPFLWAALPPIAIAAVEKVVFGTSLFGTLVRDRFSGGQEGAKFRMDGSMNVLEHLSPGSFLLSPGLCIGLALAAAFLYAAARLRRARDPL